MKVVVITGSTRGIGYGLAKAFLELGCAVVVSGRAENVVARSVAALVSVYGDERLAGFPSDVTDLESIEHLWEFSVKRFGRVDIWINNAGVGHEQLPPWEISPEQMRKILETNVLGTLYGSRTAMRGMLAQGSGQIYNLEGFGSRGNFRKGMSIYGTTKAAITYFSRAMAKEAENTPVQVGTLSPGMVITDLVLNQYKEAPERLEKIKPFLNIIAHRVETVTPALAKRVLSNDKNNIRIAWDNPLKMAWRFLSQPFTKRDVFSPPQSS